mgnify:CR=1 FL=1
MTKAFSKFKATGACTVMEPLTIGEKDKRGLRALWQMLRYRRPHGSAQERRFIADWLRPLPGIVSDQCGNRIGRIPKKNGAPSSVLWSSHTDTVHRVGGLQKLAYDANKHVVRLSTNERNPECLGADCTTGVWLMREMILAQVPGLYVFHRGEECGGIGSSSIAKNTPQLLDGIRAAIAFDRRGTQSIITHQGGSRCGSDAFSASLSSALGSEFGFASDMGGTFTDTANYTSLVPECTNLSIGYYSQHSASETQDFGFAQRLLAALLVFDEDRLVIERNPADADLYEDWEFGGGYFGSDRFGSKRSATGRRRSRSLSYRQLERLVNLYPDIAVDLLADIGVDEDQVDDLLAGYGTQLSDLDL